MNDDTINDLKQFIAATVHQEVSGIVDGVEDRLGGKFSDIHKKFDELDKKIDNRSDEILSAIGDTTSDRFDAVEEDVKNLDIRVTKLESNNA